MLNYDQNNIFAKIIRGEIPAKKIYEDDKILAFEDINKIAPIHVLVVPKGEYISFADFTSKASFNEIAYFFNKVTEIAGKLDLLESGFRLITNNGKDAAQSVLHFHIHIIGKKQMKESLL